MSIPSAKYEVNHARKKPYISELHLEWLLAQLARVQKSLPINSALEKDIGNIIGRFKTEITDENSASSKLSLSTEEKFFRMLDDIAEIMLKEKFIHDKINSHISEHDHMMMLFMLEEILKKAEKLGAFR